MPHITLARKTRLRQTLSNLPAKKHPFYIKQLALIESQLKEEGPLYTPLIIAPAE
ncbi:MAG: hypothetical protein GXZ04_07185 [Clostridiales bacterium]|nr:hypothetical protein [Clostridiales bacterium]